MARQILNRLKMEYIYFWARRLPACDELLPLMSRRMDGKLTWRQRLKLNLHIHICDWCKRYADQLLLIRQAMRQQESEVENNLVADEFLSTDARERMKRALDQS